MKPTLRGWVHQEAFFFSLCACLLMITQAKSDVAFLGSLVYSTSLLFLFGMSAVYHRPHWEPKPRALLKRFDHCAIFVFIAGSFTPICLLGLPGDTGKRLLVVIWIAAFIGILQSVFWVKAPKWVSGVLYVGVGWLSLPYLPELKQSLGPDGALLLLWGGIAYTVGAVFYVLKKPNFRPGVFGYHELFHVMTVLAAGLHFVAIYRLIVR